MSSGAEEGNVCTCVCVCVYALGELALTQTQPPHCPPPSPVRMFEGRLIAWLPLISAGTKNPVARSTSAFESKRGTRRGVVLERLLSKIMEQSITDYI